MKAFELLAICPGRLLSSFQNNLDEITIIATPDDEDVEGQMNLPKNVQLHSFLDPAKGHADKSLHTQLAVDTREVFLDYRHSSSQTTDVTFNLKDFKALLVLCEGLGANVAICFDQPGSPLLVHPVFHSNNPLEEYVTAELVLATLLESARLGNSGPATVAANARRRVDTPGGGGQIPGDTPWHPVGESSLQPRRTPLGQPAPTPGSANNLASGSESPVGQDQDGAGPTAQHPRRSHKQIPSGLLDDGHFSEPCDGASDGEEAGPSKDAGHPVLQGLQQHAHRPHSRPEHKGDSQREHHDWNAKHRGQSPACGGFQDSEWQGDEPISRRYLAADIEDDDDEDLDGDAIPGTP
ncbi:hypothetical protein CVIRNUC_008463 [Coccomyxa viridis]|uniref:Cell cycle checkpoint control protein RAD9A n=1 Tax=Coccomyxa viridis TaxID=1274662 RepID=A0AAV1IF15_9CHLO|nr:hypothetical protein CVIRNUC_008463 [Coccomyxa viridis]